MDVNGGLISLVSVCDHRTLMRHLLVAIVFYGERKFVGVVLFKDVRLFLVEKLDALLRVTQQNVFGVNHNFISRILCVYAHVDLESPIFSVSESDHFFCILGFFGLMQSKDLALEMLAI